MNQGFACFALALMFLSSGIVHAQDIPMVNDDPKVDKKMDAEIFDFVSKTLGAGRMASHMKCTLKTKNSRQLRKFSDRSEWVEVLEIDFNSNGYDSGLKMKFKIPMSARYGSKKSENQWSGLGEDFKIVMDDYYGHWLKFSHDGQGRLVQLSMGNNLRIFPCFVK